MKLKALIFDVDGTLADTEEVHRCAFNIAFERHGLDWNWSKPKYAHLLLTTGGKERIGAYIDSLPLAPDDQRALTMRIQAIHKTKTEIYTSMILEGKVPLREGAQRLIDEAEASNVKLAIASTTTLANIEALLCANLGADALGRFAAIGAGDLVKRKKPAPDIYEYVLRELGFAAEDCVAIEDSSNGLISAKSAGLYTVVTPSYWTRAEDFSAADLVLPSLGSHARPLPPRAAALIGSTVVGVRELDRQLDGIRV
jgi:HAD superfamily hydrolase (TIGR01509 family)